MKTTAIFPLLFLVLLIAPIQSKAQKQTGVLDPQPSKVDTRQIVGPRVKKINDSITSRANSASGETRFLLRPIQEAKLSAAMGGVIDRIHYRVGQRFTKGKTLISMKCGGPRAQVDAQKAKLRRYTLEHQSSLDLYAGQAVSKYDVDIAKANLDEQKAVYKSAMHTASLCTIKAPFSGGVVSVFANAYETISNGQELLEIVNDKGLVMSLNISSNLINKVQVGDAFSILVDETGGTYMASVTGVSPAIDAISKTIELRAKLDLGIEELKPGMSGRAILDSFQ